MIKRNYFVTFRWNFVSLVSMTPTKDRFSGVVDTDKVCICWCRSQVRSPQGSCWYRSKKKIRVSLTDVLDTGEEIFTGVNDSGNSLYICFVRVNLYENLEKTKTFLSMPIGTRRSCLTKKSEVIISLYWPFLKLLVISGQPRGCSGRRCPCSAASPVRGPSPRPLAPLKGYSNACAWRVFFWIKSCIDR